MKNNVELLVDELAINNIDRESMHWVDVTHVISPTNFYVRPIRFNVLVNHYENLNTFIITSPIKVEQLVFYNLLYSRGRIKYVRAIITNIYNDSQECDIFAIDHGFTKERVPVEHLMECPPDLLDTPALAFRSLLCNCFPVDYVRGWTRFSNCVFNEYLLEGRVKMTILGRTTRQLILNLMNTDLEDVATLLAIKGYAKLGSYNSCIPWKPLIIRKRYYFNFKELHVDDTFRVRVLGGKSLKLFYVKEVNDYETFLNKIDDISFYARKQYPLLPHHLVEGAVVCVKDVERNTYDRAFIKRVTKHGSTAVLHLVDWGRDEEFTIDKIKYMCKEAIKTPMTTIMCSAPKNQAWDNGFKEFLTPGFEFYIKIKTLGYQLERKNKVDILPIEEVEIEVGATCLGYNDYYNKPKEPNPGYFLQEFHEDESQNLKPQNILPEIPMEEESLEELVAWIKGMGIRRPNKKPRYTFLIIKKYTDVKDFSTEEGYYAFQNDRDMYVSQKLISNKLESEEVIQAVSQKESLLCKSGDIEDTNISKSKPEECLPINSDIALKLNLSTSKSDDEESFPSNATATVESDASSVSSAPTVL